MLYTLGYSGWPPQAIQETAQERHAVVCDIRYSPASHHPQWRKRQLSQLLGARYQHVRALGNRNYKNGGPIELADYEVGKQVIAERLATGQRVILMCACKDVAMCHRLTAAEQLAADFSVPITHLVLPKKGSLRRRRGDFFRGVTGRCKAGGGASSPGGHTLDVGRIIYCPTARERSQMAPVPPLYFRLSFPTHLRYIEGASMVPTVGGYRSLTPREAREGRTWTSTTSSTRS